jgi:hypothetical protein
MFFYPISPLLSTFSPSKYSLEAGIRWWRRVREVGRKAGSKYLPDGVSGTETDPLRNGAVGLLGLGQLDLGAERLVALEDVLAIVLLACVFLPSLDRVRRA